MKQIFYKLDQLFWLLGNLYKHLLIGDIKECKDTYCWILIHLSYSSNCIDPGSPKFKDVLISLFGLVMSIAIIMAFSYLLFKTL